MLLLLHNEICTLIPGGWKCEDSDVGQEAPGWLLVLGLWRSREMKLGCGGLSPPPPSQRLFGIIIRFLFRLQMIAVTVGTFPAGAVVGGCVGGLNLFDHQFTAA